MRPELQKKIDQSIRILRMMSNAYGGVMELGYSGGKDSDVILQLAREAGIPIRAKAEAEPTPEDSILDRMIPTNKLTIRPRNRIEELGIKTYRDLVRYKRNDIVKQRNLGKKSLSEIDELLENVGL